MNRELYAIQHIPSGGYLPEVGKSYTRSEHSTKGIPRLFASAGGAKRALAWWLKGITTVRMVAPGFSWDGSDDPEEDWDILNMPERKAEDMKVVPVVLLLP